MKKIVELIKQICTDVKGRAEIKMILGVPIVILSVVYGIMTKDWEGFRYLFGAGILLMGVTAVTDTILDTSKTQEKKEV